MKNTPLVSILIPVYNAEAYIYETLQSLLKQTYSNIEIILVDDGSTDKSIEILQEFAKKYRQVQVFTQENSGASIARNRAYKESVGTYIQYFDADDIMDENKILLQMEALKKYNYDSNIVATGKWVKFHENIRDAKIQRQLIDKHYDDILLYFKESWENGEYIIGQSWLFHRDMHTKIGHWKEDLSLDDDGDFFARVAYASKQTVFVENSLVYWRQDNLNSLSKDPSYSAMKSRLKVFDGYMSIVEENANYDGLKRALTIKYSDHLLHTYFKYPDIADMVMNRIIQLGFSKPLYPKSPKLAFAINIFGIYISFYLLRLKQYLQKK